MKNRNLPLPTHKRFNDLAGKKFNKLTILFYDGTVNKRHVWACLCDCGVQKIITAKDILSGNTKSCGCLVKISHTKTHGQTGTTEYRTWMMMKSRCTNKNFHKYKHYGERGIVICDRWINSFENFYYDMGDKPSSKHSIERHDNDGNYTYSNCYWANPITQSRNRRLQKNNTNGIAGIWDGGGKFQITISNKYIGITKDFFEACCIRKSAENKLWILNESLTK